MKFQMEFQDNGYSYDIFMRTGAEITLKNKKISRLPLLAMFTTIAFTIFMIESAIPPIVPIPGIKLGLSNIITLVLIAGACWQDAFIVLMMRILLGSIFAGQMMSFFYSLAGGLLCLLAMTLMHRLLGSKLLWFTSIIGALCHNIGQIGVAALVLGSGYVFYYFPFLLVSGVITGLFTGLCAQFLLPRLPKF